MAGFEEEYAKLNNEQKRAVDTIDGPVLVIAGPGTGKTQLLSMRVANIMRATDTDASGILCLTFTDKAASNMRDRLLKLVGPESTKVKVKTFHSFAAEIMNSYPDYFWNGARLSTAPDALQLEVIQNILLKLPLSHPLAMKFAGNFTKVPDVQSALRLAKEAGLTPEKLRDLLRLNLNYIKQVEPLLADLLSETITKIDLEELLTAVKSFPEQKFDLEIAPLISLRTVLIESLSEAVFADEGTGKKSNTSKWKSKILKNNPNSGKKEMRDERTANEWWLAFCDVYEEYRDTLHKLGHYDYSDMLLEVIVQMEKHDDLRSDVQEQFQYVLIDEFQDSNKAQLRLAHLVADHFTAEGRPNIMAVGDDDQSIFAFNGAELNNMLFFERTYSEVTNVALKENYRSSQSVLTIAEKVIEQTDDRLVHRIPGLSKDLTAMNPPKTVGEISRFVYPTREHQFSGIARIIQRLHTQNEKEKIAVLAYKHESLIQLASILTELNVPVNYEKRSNVLDYEIVRQIINILELADSISEGNLSLADELTAKIIQHPMWKISPEELWKLATSKFRKSDWLTSLRESENDNMKNLGEWILWLSHETSYQPLPRILEYVVGLEAGQHMTSPIHDYYIRDKHINSEYVQSLSALRLLRQLSAGFSTSENPTLSEFLRFVKINDENSKSVTDESAFVSSDTNVNLLTVHKAKGLEFDQVFIIDAVENKWKPSTNGRKPPSNLPLKRNGDEADDFIRLMYVAVTRAKHSVIVASYETDANGKELLATPYIRAALPDEIKMDASDIPVEVILEENIRWPRLPVKDEREILQNIMSRYQLSATHLLNFLDITRGGPEHFLTRSLLHLPSAKTIPLAYGNAMHSAMQMAQNLQNKNQFDLAKVSDWFERALKQEFMRKEDEEKYIVKGREVLDRLFNEYGYELKAGSLAEQIFDGVTLGESLLNGKIDDFYVNGDYACITDYKTGKPVNFSSNAKDIAVKKWSHISQLVFYAVLMKHHPKYQQINKVECRMVYVESDERGKYIQSYTPSENDIKRMEKLILAIWDKIHALDFPDISKYPPDAAGILQFEDDLIADKQTN